MHLLRYGQKDDRLEFSREYIGTAPSNFLIDVLIESYLQELGPKFPEYKVYNRSLLLVFLHWNDSNFVQELSKLEDK